jgi:endo-1,4-beta-xylanase
VTSLRALAQRRGLSIGAEVEHAGYLDDARYAGILAREFNMLTPGNAMKFAAVRPRPDVYDFADAERIVSFARAHDMQVRGHTLVWHRQVPDWLADARPDRREALGVLRDHIVTVVHRFRGRVAAWDVVNEAITEDGALTPSVWLGALGPEYIALAFEWAHEADPRARLFYNEWGADGLNPKSDAVYALVHGLLGRGVSIHGIGLQMHTSLVDTDLVGAFPGPREIEANMRRFAELGLDIHVTEMDVQVARASGSLEARLAAQARVYRDVLSVGLRIPAFKALVLWGVTDRDSWIPTFTGRPDAPLLFDESDVPKPAYYALQESLAGV